MEYIARRARESDLDRIRAINISSLSENYPKSFWKEKFSTGSAHYVAIRRDQPAGSRNIAGYLATMPFEGQTMIYSLAVRQEARRRGVARALLRAFLEEFQGDWCVLDVRSDNNAAIHLYKSNGFKSQREKQAYYGDGCSAIEMKFFNHFN